MQPTMNEDIKKYPVFALSTHGLVSIDLENTEQYNHYTHHLHHYIKRQEWERDEKWFKERGIKQKLILMPIWVHKEIHGMEFTDAEFEKKIKISRWDLLFNRKHTKY